MTTYAYVPVVPGPVKEVFVGSALFEMHPDTAALWHECPDGTQYGYTYDGMTFDAPAAPSAAQLWLAHQVEAYKALAVTDSVANRCFKATKGFPAEWQTYTATLRAIVAASSGDPTVPLPTQPAFPAGT